MRRCGKSGLELPLLGVGCWPFGGGEYWGEQSQDDVNDVVSLALDSGCDYFNTAEAYNQGASEASLGIALKGRRPRAIIGTTISPSNCHPATMKSHCEASLKRLQTDYIDIYMIHWPIHPHSVGHFTNDVNIINNPPSVEDAMDTLMRLRAEGKIRHIGLSNHGIKRFREALGFCPDIALNELPYCLLTRGIENEILPYCERNGIGVVVYMPLMQGILTDRYPTLTDVPKRLRRTRHFSAKNNELIRHGADGSEEQTARTLSEIRRIARASGMLTAELALRWVISRKEITCALVGSRSTQEFTANLKSLNAGPLPPDIIDELNSVTKPLMDELGTGFDYYESIANDRT